VASLLARATPLALLAVLCLPVAAAPFTPASDAEVVERLPANTDPAARAVESMRRQLAARPDDAALRLDVASRYFELAMAQGDPRYVGYASAAIAPLERSGTADARYWLLRGLVQQYSHQFDAALASLRRASEADPAAVDPVAWRAAIRMVQARYADAAAECARLREIADALFAAGCQAYVDASTGKLAPAYAALSEAVARAGSVAPAIVLWQSTRLAEMAVRLQRWDEAERHFRQALAQGITDQFLLGAYADFLLLRNRPAEVLKLLAGWERSDVLLLRLALAGRAVQHPRAGEWAKLLRERFDEAARRGDRLHEQEAARTALDLEGDAARALALAKSNYAIQKEPRDAEVLLRAALAAKQPAEARPVLDWLQASGYEDPVLAGLAARAGSR
jgi:Tfp pilus assembly protein PilF